MLYAGIYLQPAPQEKDFVIPYITIECLIGLKLNPVSLPVER